jgi:hypothetical protein
MMKVGHAQRLLLHAQDSPFLTLGREETHARSGQGDDDDEMLEEWPTARKPSKQGGQKGRRQN